MLDRAQILMVTCGPRELEEETARLLGAELHRVVSVQGNTLWFDWWLEELLAVATARALRALSTGDPVWRMALRLLHGLSSICPPAMRFAARSAIDRVTAEATGATVPPEPDWLPALSRIAATGQTWLLRDGYGSRLAVVAGFSYPDGRDPAVFLFDVTASGLVGLTSSGVFDDVHQASSAWRELVGEAAVDAVAQPMMSGDCLLFLVQCELGERVPDGTESRAQLDDWFRAGRRFDDLAQVLRTRGIRLPAPVPLYQGVDPSAMVSAFCDWYAALKGSYPDLEAVDALAQEWMEGSLPETWRTISPDRVEFTVRLLDDWIPDDPVTIAAKSLLPAWVRWHGEQTGLPEHLIARAVAVAE